MLHVPEPALAHGFANGPGGAHTSRTMMLAELELLLAACPPDATYQDYQTAILDDNVLLKRTASTRRESLRRLRELYGLDAGLLVFRSLVDLWYDDARARPLLALLCAIARDPILRSSAGLVLATPVSSPITPQQISAAVDSADPGRLNPTTLANIGRHAASSWRQSGHLAGKYVKTRTQAECRPAAVAYALLLGHLCGDRGEALFETFWAQLLDTPLHVLHDQAFAASQQGWIDYRHTGMVTEITFRHLLREEE